jgi:glycosyltransferase involved in cell wall biosynthesis
VPRSKGGRTDWWHEARPMPANMRMVSLEEAHQRVADGAYEAVVCHSVADLCDLPSTPMPRIVVFHVSRTRERAHGQVADAFDKEAGRLLCGCRCVFISASKQASWGYPGVVIPPAIALQEYGGYSGDSPAALIVGNLLCELSQTNALPVLDGVVRGLPLTILGLNPSISCSRLTQSWDDLRAQMRVHRVFLNNTRAPYEDGYNLAMLEAMATGMPILSLPNPTSPLTDGVDGFVSEDPQVLRERLLELMEDRALATRLGQAARDTVGRLFPMDAFSARWRAILHGSELTIDD